jgi:hypothetical protein
MHLTSSALASWGEVEALLSARYRVAAREASSLDLHWEFPTQGGAPVVQPVSILLVRALGRSWLQVLSVVAHESDLDARAGLARNVELPCGTIGLQPPWLVLQHRLGLPVLADELGFFVERLPYEAARLRRDLEVAAGRSGGGTVFCEELHRGYAE